MSLEENKKLVVNFYDALKRKDLDAAASLCDESFVFYNQVDTPRNGIQGFLASEQKNLDAFEGYSMDIETIAEGDNVVAYIVFEGDQSREMQEERRNCFVAITRTQETLSLTYSERLQGWVKQPSRFLAEMGVVTE